MPDADDDDYRSYCDTLKQAAQDVIDAVNRNDYERARKSGGEIHKSCSDCHELYRA
jgi:cytochrome c556